MSGPTSLGEALPLEMARVRDQVLPVYASMPEGRIAAAMMRADLDAAAKALVAGEVVDMVRIYESLKGWQL